MEIRAARPDDWLQIWPFFRDIVTEGETYAYPDDITAEQAQDLWTPGPDGFTAVAIAGDESGLREERGLGARMDGSARGDVVEARHDPSRCGWAKLPDVDDAHELLVLRDPRAARRATAQPDHAGPEACVLPSAVRGPRVRG